MNKVTMFLLACAFTLSPAVQADILPILPDPDATELTGPVFVQPFAGLNITSFSGGIGTTEPFFDTIPPGAIPGAIVNILGNFQAFDPFGNPTSFDILDIHVTEGGSTFTPQFGSFNFAGQSSLTLTDSLTFNMVTFSAADPTLAFVVPSEPFQFTLDTNLPLNSSITFQIGETGVIPEPAAFLPTAVILATLTLIRFRGTRHTPTTRSISKKLADM